MRRLCLVLGVWLGTVLAAEPPWPTYGWLTSTPEEQGMDSARLEQADAWIRDNSPNRYSLLVVRHGRLVYERYYNGAGPYTPYHIASISKSFLSALTGLAIDQGVIGLEDRWFDTFPEYLEVADPRTASLRLRHMLTMAAGLDWRDSDIWQVWAPAPQLYPDWIHYVLTRQVHAVPGERFFYNTGNTHLLSAFLTRRTGRSTLDFARTHLLGPLGIAMGDWWRDVSPQHYYTGGWGMHIAPRDLAKFGYLYLRDGAWEGRQLVPSGWVRASTSPQIRHNRGSDDFYGYLWWMDNLHGFFIPSARGMGMQRIWYCRELDLVVVTTGDYWGSSPDTVRIVNDYVIPSLYRGPPEVRAVVNAAGGQAEIAPDSFGTLYGANLAPAGVEWGPVILDGKTLPSELGGVKVLVGGRNAWVSYAGPGQVNFLVPEGLPAGAAELEVSHPGGSAKTTVVVAPVSPALFGYSLEGRPRAIATGGGEIVQAAVPNDYLELYANGLGGTAAPHPSGEVLTRAFPHAGPLSVEVYFGAARAEVQGVNMTYAGLWQVNVRVPEDAPPGDVAVTIRIAGSVSPPAWLRIG